MCFYLACFEWACIGCWPHRATVLACLCLRGDKRASALPNSQHLLQGLARPAPTLHHTSAPPPHRARLRTWWPPRSTAPTSRSPSSSTGEAPACCMRLPGPAKIHTRVPACFQVLTRQHHKCLHVSEFSPLTRPRPSALQLRGRQRRACAVFSGRCPPLARVRGRDGAAEPAGLPHRRHLRYRAGAGGTLGCGRACQLLGARVQLCTCAAAVLSQPATVRVPYTAALPCAQPACVAVHRPALSNACRPKLHASAPLPSALPLRCTCATWLAGGRGAPRASCLTSTSSRWVEFTGICNSDCTGIGYGYKSIGAAGCWAASVGASRTRIAHQLPPAPLPSPPQVDFPERPGALRKFLGPLSPRWNVTLFHYRRTGGWAGGNTQRVLLLGCSRGMARATSAVKRGRRELAAWACPFQV